MREGENINWRWIGIGFVIFIVLAGIAGRVDYEDALLEEQAYCENVRVFKETGGQRGWPDYNDNYDEMCVK